MKTFQQFINEAYDPDIQGRSQITKSGEGGRIGRKDYKPRKDIGTNKPRSRTQQQPEKPRGSAALSPREAQKKAAMERRAAKSGAKTKTADELLAKKAKKTVSPKYKPVKATGYTTAERQKITRAGQRLVKDIKQGKEKPISQYDPGIRKS